MRCLEAKGKILLLFVAAPTCVHGLFARQTGTGKKYPMSAGNTWRWPVTIAGAGVTMIVMIMLMTTTVDTGEAAMIAG